MCHNGQLPDSYKLRLTGLSLTEIAAEAAKFRSDSKHRPGTSTTLILRWTITNLVSDQETKNHFLGLYREAWKAEKAARHAGTSRRPTERPVVGARYRPKSHYLAAPVRSMLVLTKG